MSDVYVLLTIGFIGLVIGFVAWVLLRTPVKLTLMAGTLSELDLKVASLESNVKKCLRRVGIAEKKARDAQVVEEETSEDPSQMHLFPHADGSATDPSDPLGHAARLARIHAAAAERRRHK